MSDIEFKFSMKLPLYLFCRRSQRGFQITNHQNCHGIRCNSEKKLLILTWTSNIQMSSTSVAAVRRQPAVVTRMAAALRHKVSAAQSINLGRVHTASRSVCRRFLCGEGTHRKVKKGCSRNHGSEGTGLTTVGEDIRIFHHVTMKILTAQNSVTILTTCHRI